MDTDGNIWTLVPLSALRLTAAAEMDSVGGRITGLVLLFVLFVIGGAYFGGAESGFSAMNKIRIKAKADDGDRRAKNAIYIVNNFERALTTLLIGNNIMHIAAASIATVIATRLFGTSDRVSLICTVITTFVVFLFSEMIPKSFANDRSETTSLLCAGFLRVLMKLLTPLTAFFTWISSAFTKLASRFLPKQDEPSITEEELYDIIDTIEEEGVVDEEQGDLLKSALDFSGTHAEDVMTMPQDICAVDVSLPNEAILAIVQESTHTRLPVFEGDLDHIIGILQIRTFLRGYRRNPKTDVRSLMMPAFRVRPEAMIDDLLSEMRQHKFYLGIVSDEAGKTLGLVTIEDFLEELVGEIWDEDDVVDKDFIKLGGNRFRVNTHMTVKELCSRLSILPPPAAERPILAVLLEQFGKIPEEDDTFLYLDNLEITVESVEDARVNTVCVRLLSEEDPADHRPEERRAASAPGSDGSETSGEEDDV